MPVVTGQLSAGSIAAPKIAPAAYQDDAILTSTRRACACRADGSLRDLNEAAAISVGTSNPPLVLYFVNMLPIDGRAKQIVRVIVIVIGIISLLKYLAVF